MLFVYFFLNLHIVLQFSMITSKINVRTSIKHAVSNPRADCDGHAPELTESTIITSFENFTIAKSTFFYEDRPPTYTYRILNYNLTIEENLSDKNKQIDDCILSQCVIEILKYKGNYNIKSLKQEIILQNAYFAQEISQILGSYLLQLFYKDFGDQESLIQFIAVFKILKSNLNRKMDTIYGRKEYLEDLFQAQQRNMEIFIEQTNEQMKHISQKIELFLQPYEALIEKERNNLELSCNYLEELTKFVKANQTQLIENMSTNQEITLKQHYQRLSQSVHQCIQQVIQLFKFEIIYDIDTITISENWDLASILEYQSEKDDNQEYFAALNSLNEFEDMIFKKILNQTSLNEVIIQWDKTQINAINILHNEFNRITQRLKEIQDKQKNYQSILIELKQSKDQMKRQLFIHQQDKVIALNGAQEEESILKYKIDKISNFISLLSNEMQGGKLSANFEDDFFELDEEQDLLEAY